MGVPTTDWLIDPGAAYLNHGGFGALPVRVAEAAAAIRRDIEANPTDLFMRRYCCYSRHTLDGAAMRAAGEPLRGP